ncbi:BppU family phage baseplate upper protein [Paraclostridium sordellii]|uniref:BppU family phage baseplate upper protein n=1 Tax=Paraclostridium sordellii TaxID=1505 RepID=UPI0005E057BA|nr:BppU family phage baseplate upper protein [Paeniclostridium sordellii]CEN86369.1 Uncharacterised protein [[Clostridium] sordellii] [Paeniclostridium sordellii]
MAINNFHFKLDIEREDHIPKFRLKQYDTAIFYASLYKNGLPYHFENEQIKMFVKKADGTIVYQEDNITIQDDEVKINVKNQALTASGLTYAELELKSSTGQITTATFLFEVKEKVGSDKAIESITDICTLEKLDRYVGQAKKELDKFKQDLSKLEDLVANKDKLEGQNTEAKVNIKGLERVLEQANNIVDNGGKKVTGNNVVSESSNGFTQNLKLSGITLINLACRETLEIGNTQTAIYANFNNKAIRFDNITIANKSSKTVIYGVYDVASTNWIRNIEVHSNEVKCVQLKSNEYIGNIIGGYSDGFENSETSKAEFKKAMMFFEGDVTNYKFGYFEGLKSVGDGVENIEITTIKADTNLFNPDECINGKYVGDSGVLAIPSSPNNPTDFNVAFIEIPTGNFSITISGLTNSIVTGEKFAYLGFYDKNKNPIRHHYFNVKNPLTRTFTNSDIGFIAVTVKNEDLVTLNVTIGNEVKPYTQYGGSKKKLLYYDSNAKVWKKPILRSSNKLVKDTIENYNNKVYYRPKCIELSINGSENWVFDGDLGNTIRCYLRNSNIRSGLVASDRFNSIQNYALDKEHIYASDGLLWVFLNKSKATDLNTFKNYFKGTPTTVVCPIKEEFYECLDISTRSFNPQTLFSVSSGAIDPGIEYYIPSSFISSDSSISEKLENVDDSLLKLMFDFISHNHDKRYDLKNLGSVTDFNTALEPGRYYVFKEGGSIPNAPYSGNIYGALEVFHTNDTELIQRFTSANGKIYTRLKNFEGTWWAWSNMTNIGDFSWDFNNTTGTGFQKLPSGMIIQFGTTKVSFNDNSCIGTAKIYYPLAFTKFCKCTGNLETNSYGGYNETNAIVGGQTLTNGYAEVRDIQGRPRTGYTATVTWIAIGI